jgi:two-component system nitrogen regulation response regulator NtrX
VERLMIMVQGDRVTPDDVRLLGNVAGDPPQGGAAPEAVAPLHTARDEFEKAYILRALASQHGNMSKTADLLGVERSNLYRKMRGFGIGPARKSDDDSES